MKNKLIALLLCYLIMLPCIGAGSVYAWDDTNTVGEPWALADGIVAFNMAQAGASSVQTWIDGELSATAGVSAEWYILSLSQSGEYDFSSYEAALLEFLGENKIHSASSRQKYALCLVAVGSTDGYISSVMEDSIGEQGIMSFIYGLHLLNNGYKSDMYTAEDVADKLLSLRCDDGGWSLTGENGDVDVTAMTVQALSVYYDTSAEVKDAIDGALSFLSDRQLDGGDYSSYGVSNPESTAQVLVALSSLGLDYAEDERFIKNGNTLIDGIAKYRLEDGSFCHREGEGTNLSSTSQVLYAMVSYMRMSDGNTPLYILDNRDPEGVEPAPVTSADSSQTLDGALTESDGEDVTDTQAADNESNGSYKPWVCLAIVALGGAVCLVLFLFGKRNVKNFIAVGVAVAVCVVFVCVTSFQTADDYYNGEEITKENCIGNVTMTIRCDTVVGRSDAEHIPSDGIILEAVELEIQDGDTVYSILTEAARRYNIQVENNGSSDMAYIVGINYLYELDFGDLSGWVYHVNGQEASVGCSDYLLSDGDVIEWHYTCQLGEDVKLVYDKD